MSLLHRDKQDDDTTDTTENETTPAADTNSEEWLDQPADPSLDEDRPETADSHATSVVQIEGESSPKKVTTLIDDVTQGEKIKGIEFTIQVPIADSNRPGASYDQIVSNLKSEVMQFGEKHNLGAINFTNKELDEFVNDEVEERSELEHAKAAGPDEEVTG